MEIRRVRGEDGDQLRDVRLRALADAPYAFSSSLEREQRLPPEFWRDRARESDRGETGVVFVAVDAGRAVGMAGGFLVDGEATVAMLWGMWIDPADRGRGLAERLIDAVAGWSGGVGAVRLRLAVTDCEAARPAATLYRRLGFVDTGEREPLEWNPALITRILARSIAPPTD